MLPIAMYRRFTHLAHRRLSGSVPGTPHAVHHLPLDWAAQPSVYLRPSIINDASPASTLGITHISPISENGARTPPASLGRRSQCYAPSLSAVNRRAGALRPIPLLAHVPNTPPYGPSRSSGLFKPLSPQCVPSPFRLPHLPSTTPVPPFPNPTHALAAHIHPDDVLTSSHPHSLPALSLTRLPIPTFALSHTAFQTPRPAPPGFDLRWDDGWTRTSCELRLSTSVLLDPLVVGRVSDRPFATVRDGGSDWLPPIIHLRLFDPTPPSPHLRLANAFYRFPGTTHCSPVLLNYAGTHSG
ncbi:hypothetical protein B0H16DRAFT_1719137 [Mycena metata]|uniref:Uncharacterized protein n=1 Tax=Mycena metata TaxID=1033252 RepID=A0AAD7NI54_9AGAR|nr:hypothetical protein B0H16DRAFT_1719137 [Mycena metata]